jgi:rubredoxin
MMSSKQVPMTRQLSPVKAKHFACPICGVDRALFLKSYEAILAYCEECKATYMFTSAPDAYLCPKCKGKLTFVHGSVVSAKCSSCKEQADFVCSIDDWDTFRNTVFDVVARQAQPGNSVFLLALGQPIIVKPGATSTETTKYKLHGTTELTGVAMSEGKPDTAKKFKMPDTAIAKLREIMKKKWQDPEYRRRVVEGMRKRQEVKKSAAAGGE